MSNLPIIIGFGIRTSEQALKMASISDGIVMGSAVVEKIKYSLDKGNLATRYTVSSCLEFISEVSSKFKLN